jgi:hypothetical protein
MTCHRDINIVLTSASPQFPQDIEKRYVLLLDPMLGVYISQQYHSPLLYHPLFSWQQRADRR